MNGHDEQFVRKCVALGLVRSPCLELGAAVPYNSKPLVTAAGVEYVGADIAEGPDVAAVADFEDAEAVERAFGAARFNSALALNVLEHTFDPVRVLDHLVNLLNPGAALVVVTPVVWPLHDFPMDCWRINPNFYEEYARRRGLTLAEPFEYVTTGEPVRSLVGPDGSYRLPPPTVGPFKSLRSRVVHRLFRTTGRGVLFKPHVALGAVLVKPQNSATQA